MAQKAIGKTIKGATHSRKDIDCQDNSKHSKKDESFILVVADGHGSDSCPYSKEGSQLAVNLFKSYMVQLLKDYKDHMDSLMTVLNREGDMRISRDICRIWQDEVVKQHHDQKRSIPLDDTGEEDYKAIWKQYGTTLVGLMVTPTFLFGLQIGDGDIVFIDHNGVFSRVIEGDKILGVETHSLSRENAWEKALSVVKGWDLQKELPSAFILTSDGFANSFRTEEAYQEACKEYYEMLKEYGPNVIKDKLTDWLNDTSQKGCGDDISMQILFNYEDGIKFKSETQSDDGD